MTANERRVEQISEITKLQASIVSQTMNASTQAAYPPANFDKMLDHHFDRGCRCSSARPPREGKPVLDTFPSKIITQFAWAPIEAWTSAVASATEYAARAVSRRSSPLDIAQDLAEFARVATLREKPKWAHESREIRSWPVARLIDYSAPSHTASVPTLVLPPQAGHGSSIVDYGRGQSQMMTLRDGGLDHLYAIDWLPATAETADYSIEEFVAVL